MKYNLLEQYSVRGINSFFINADFSNLEFSDNMSQDYCTSVLMLLTLK
ncbi:hypothetical protein EV693_10742 [Nicoletella semolina]|uniref:Uncharacterized protein n=1 Tax=Nicoletella semolina TaxID=271160 RepID=A0A4R2N884_9PAST|nr:hypothetical protein EV693_10742 [Nicoletella semolina]